MKTTRAAWQKGACMHTGITMTPMGTRKQNWAKASYKEKLVKRDPLSDPQSKDVFLDKQNGLQPLLIAALETLTGPVV